MEVKNRFAKTDAFAADPKPNKFNEGGRSGPGNGGPARLTIATPKED